MRTLVCAAILAVLPGVAGIASAAEASRPNILFILIDDLGWSDLGCYGHPWHRTPNIDSLAADGMRFTDAYAPAPICSASRASFLTGKTPARLHFEFVTKSEPTIQVIKPQPPLVAPPITLRLELEEKTVAEVLDEAGYETAFFGKWHVSPHYKRYLGWSPTHGPRQQGFQTAIEDFGVHPYSYGPGDRDKPDDIFTEGVFPPDSMTQRAVRYIHQPHAKPFFLMVSDFFVHVPVKTPCKWLEKYYDGLILPDSPNRKKRVVYAAFVEQMDHYVGQVLDALDEAGLRDNTLVFLTSDNGGHPEYVANHPLRGSKWNLYEGGIRAAGLVRWPGQVRPGTVCSTPVAGYDLLATFADVAGTTAATDGVSLKPVFDDPAHPLDRPLYWHFPYYHPEKGYAEALDKVGIDDFAVSKTKPQSAIRCGRYKLLMFYEDDHVELYDLASDLGEQHDLSRSQPERAADMKARLQRLLAEADARFPTPARQGDPK